MTIAKGVDVKRGLGEKGVEPLAMQIFAGIVLLVIGIGIAYAVFNWAGAYTTAIKCDISLDKNGTTLGKPTSGENTDTIQLTINYVMGTKETVTLDATGEPLGVRAIFSPLSGEPPFYSNMTVGVDSDAVAGNYVLTIVVKDNKGATSGSKAFNLTIQ